MSKLIFMLTALLVGQTVSAMTNGEDILPSIDGLSGSERVYFSDVLLETQRQQMLAEMKQSLRSTLIVDSRSAFTVKRPTLRIDNNPF